MGVSKKKFVEKYGVDFAASPKKFLRGHKIQSSQWSLFTDEVNGPAMQTQLLYLAHALKGATKGPMALKKAKNLCIFTYKTEGQLVDNLNDNIQSFIEGLDDADVNEFENDENIHVIGFYPNQPTSVVTLKLSVLLRNGYKGKFGRGQFVVVMFGNSAIRTQELKLAQAKAKVNARKVKKVKSPAVVKAALKKVANKKLATNARRLQKATSNRELLALQMQEFEEIASEFGASDGAGLKRKFKSYDKANQKVLGNMTAQEELIYDEILVALKAGNKRRANKLINGANSPAINLLMSDKVNSTADFLDDRVAKMKSVAKAKVKAVKNLRSKIAEFEAAREVANAEGNATESRRLGKNIASAKLRIKKYNAAIKATKVKLGMTKTIASGDFNKATFTSKSELMATVDAEVAELTATGMSIEESLAEALAKVNIPQKAKQQIIQQAVITAEEGLPVQIAAQQAIQAVDVTPQQSGSMHDLIKKYI